MTNHDLGVCTDVRMQLGVLDEARQHLGEGRSAKCADGGRDSGIKERTSDLRYSVDDGRLNACIRREEGFDLVASVRQHDCHSGNTLTSLADSEMKATVRQAREPWLSPVRT